VVRDLEQVHGRQAACDELRVDALLGVAHQQEPLRPDLAQQDDRDVVDRRPVVGRTLGHAVRVRPQDPEPDRVDRQSIARGQPPAWWCATAQGLGPRLVPRPRPEHPGLVDPPHLISLEQQREPGDVVLVRVGQHQDVDPAVPRWKPLVEGQQQPARVRAAVDHQPPASTALDEDPVPLPDVEHDDPCQPVGPVHECERQSERRRGEAGGCEPHAARRLRRAHGPPPPGDRRDGLRGPAAARTAN
jgi:hypothetical protein